MRRQANSPAYGSVFLGLVRGRQARHPTPTPTPNLTAPQPYSPPTPGPALTLAQALPLPLATRVRRRSRADGHQEPALRLRRGREALTYISPTSPYISLHLPISPISPLYLDFRQKENSPSLGTLTIA